VLVWIRAGFAEEDEASADRWSVCAVAVGAIVASAAGDDDGWHFDAGVVF